MWLEVVNLSSNKFFEDSVLRSLSASPLINPFFTPGGCQEVKSVYPNVSVSLKCVRMSRIASSWNVLHVKTLVSGKVISFFEISVVNFIVGWCVFASKPKWFIVSLPVSHRETTLLREPDDCFLWNICSEKQMLPRIICYSRTAKN